MAEFTSRQKMILANLSSQGDWLSGTEIAASLGVCKRTLQNDVKAINRAAKEPLILANNRLGYKLAEGAAIPAFGERKERVMHGKNSTPRSILILLLFTSRHLYIEEIADKLYLSRTTVNVNLAQARRIAARNREAALIVSARNGLWVEACEETKRLMCAKIMYEDLDYAAMLQMPQLAALPKIEKSIQNILPPILVRNHIIVTGQAFQDFVRFIAIGILRSQLGMRMDAPQEEKRPSVVVQELAARIEAELGYTLDPAEKALIRARCHELNVISKQPSQDSESLRTIRAFEKNVQKMTGLPLRLTSGVQKNMADHIKRMRRRILAGHYNYGQYTKEIFAGYPLETHLIKTCLQPAMGLDIPDAELGYVVLYAAAALRAFREKVDVLLVSDASVSILYTTRRHIEQMNAETLGRVETIPRYVFELDPAQYLQRCAVHLTTEPDLALGSPDFLSISAFPSEQQLEYIRRVIANQSQAQRRTRQALMQAAYPAAVEPDAAVTRAQLAALAGRDISAKTVGGSLLCVTRIDHSGRNELRLLQLRETLRYEGKNINMILYASYGGQYGILDFFDRAAQVLQENT